MDFYSCKLDSIDQLHTFDIDKVKWLDINNDWPLIEEFYHENGSQINKEDFAGDKYKMCAIIENDKIISYGGVLYMTENNWEIVAVSTLKQYRNKNYAKAISSYIAKYILEHSKKATCNTYSDNEPMKNVMKAIGMVL